jgi:hypothetical protein
VLGIKENIFAPESLDNLLTADYLPVFFQQQDEQFHGNALELQGAIMASQFKTGAIQLEITELVGGRGHETPMIWLRTIPLIGNQRS